MYWYLGMCRTLSNEICECLTLHSQNSQDMHPASLCLCSFCLLFLGTVFWTLRKNQVTAWMERQFWSAEELQISRRYYLSHQQKSVHHAGWLWRSLSDCMALVKLQMVELHLMLGEVSDGQTGEVRDTTSKLPQNVQPTMMQALLG